MKSSGSVVLLVASAIVMLDLVSTAMVPESELKRDKETERIIGGKDAKEGQFPWTVALFFNGQFICTSSIISPTTVLTAAHCVVFDDVQQSSDLFYGIANVDKRSESVLIEFSDIIVHPGYDFPDNDIAVMKTNGVIPFDENVSPVCVAGPDTPMNEYKDAFAMGWGSTSRIRFLPRIPNNLQYAELKIVANNICSIPILGASGVDEGKICAKGLFFEGICNGDSGGPLVHFSADKSPVEIGVASYINALIGCGKISPGVWTRVSEYYDFIMLAAGDGMVCTV